MKKLTASFLLLLTALVSFSQNPAQSGIESMGYGSARYYVVVGVLGIIFLGIILFLLFLERKISNLERKLDQ